MLKCEANDELINLDTLDDSSNDFFSNKPNPIELKEEKLTESSENQKTIDTILNEEIDTQNLPASPPFTKISSIKMFSNSEKMPATPLRPKESDTKIFSENDNVSKTENKTAALARKNHTKSFLPRIKKRQKQ